MQRKVAAEIENVDEAYAKTEVLYKKMDVDDDEDEDEDED